ncbi:spidroin-2-like [Acinonyx jubatus]|uniref:Spidroin-2-like n=1 Tax=Acinonyx jubatus TaxID=32536 RepID=A0ABM3NTT8_ACIJB|nr:spidroin-2-like [Acinonyx jubatus]
MPGSERVAGPARLGPFPLHAAVAASPGEPLWPSPPGRVTAGSDAKLSSPRGLVEARSDLGGTGPRTATSGKNHTRTSQASVPASAKRPRPVLRLSGRCRILGGCARSAPRGASTPAGDLGRAEAAHVHAGALRTAFRIDPRRLQGGCRAPGGARGPRSAQDPACGARSACAQCRRRTCGTAVPCLSCFPGARREHLRGGHPSDSRRPVREFQALGPRLPTRGVHGAVAAAAACSRAPGGFGCGPQGTPQGWRGERSSPKAGASGPGRGGGRPPADGSAGRARPPRSCRARRGGCAVPGLSARRPPGCVVSSARGTSCYWATVNPQCPVKEGRRSVGGGAARQWEPREFRFF